MTRGCTAYGLAAAVLRLGLGAAPIAAVERGAELETDRDSFTFAPTTAGTDASILEASYSFIDNRVGPESHSVPELLVRRGIGEALYPQPFSRGR